MLGIGTLLGQNEDIVVKIIVHAWYMC